MRSNKMILMNISLALVLVLGFSGCTVILQKGRRTDIEKISKLKNDMNELQRAKAELEKRLQNEINNQQVSRSMRGFSSLNLLKR